MVGERGSAESLSNTLCFLGSGSVAVTMPRNVAALDVLGVGARARRLQNGWAGN